MTDEQRQEIMRRQAEFMRAMSKEEMAKRQMASAEGMRQQGHLTSLEIASAQNFWPAGVEAVPMPLQYATPPPLTLWARFKRGLGAERSR